jgi:two-component system, sensor histidine kinase and response regulator
MLPLPANSVLGQSEHLAAEHEMQSYSDGAVRILMAEDNAINQRVGRLILQRAGFNIDVVGDGSEAVEAHRTKPYDVILMDCQMPIMDGFEASRAIRQLEQPQPIIVAVTANALLGEREKCLAAGMNDYLSKPFQADQLVSLVKRWCATVRR